MVFTSETWRKYLTEENSTLESTLRVYTKNGWALGDEQYRRHLEEVLERRVQPLPTGTH